MYYYNKKTEECVWEEPDGYTEPNYTLLKSMIRGTELWAAILVQSTWRAKKARANVREERGSQNAVEGEVWSAVEDPASGEYYYYNNETGDCVWDKPAELMTEEEKAAAATKQPPTPTPHLNF